MPGFGLVGLIIMFSVGGNRMGDKLVTVTFFPTEAEAAMAKNFLASRNIRAVVTSQLPTAGGAGGPGYLFDVQVEAADARRAAKLLARPLRRLRRKYGESGLLGDQQAANALGLTTGGLFTLPVLLHLWSVLVLVRLRFSGE